MSADRRGPAKVSGAIAAGMSIIFLVRVVADGNVGAVVVLLPGLVGGALAFVYPERRGMLFASAGLMAVTAAITLLRSVGMLYVPSILLILVCAFQEQRTGTFAGRDTSE